MYRVLVIGERPEDAKALAFRLGLSGFESSPSAGEFTLALRALFAFKPDAVVLEVAPSDASRELFRLLYRVSELPIVVQGDGGHRDDVIWYLEEGAADYLTRPVSPALLAARLTTVLRRTAPARNASGIRVGNLAIDPNRHQVQRDGTPIALTPTEFRLLATLAENAGRPCSHSMLLERVWGKDFVNCAHYLRLYMGYLRQKLEEDPKNPQLLITEWGLGYRLVADSRETLPAVAPQPYRAATA